VWNQPSWYITSTTNTVSNTDIAVTLNRIWQWIQSNTYTTNNNYAISGPNYQITVDVDARTSAIAGETTALLGQSRCPPENYQEGTVHEDLLGTGRFPVEGVVGFKVEVIDRNMSEVTLAGQPMYLWNMGWISILADELLLEEKRVTREGYLWFPCGIKYATEFTYTLREFTRCTVTELVPVALPPPEG